jgi:hypothetical protein
MPIVPFPVVEDGTSVVLDRGHRVTLDFGEVEEPNEQEAEHQDQGDQPPHAKPQIPPPRA